jgi:diadenosine tetraphosphate (Ap4A) HIT family hydrolase
MASPCVISTDLPKRNKCMSTKNNDCPFCNIPQDKVLAENEYAYAIRDGFPVTKLHSLIIPKCHVDDYFGLTTDELIDCNSLLAETREAILKSDKLVRGFNIGVNAGEVAGQTISHCHIHLIPRRVGDVESPGGGIRRMIPGQGDY